ncbi:unnamed protein product [Arctogadus glacialis]
MGIKDRPQCYFDVELNREPVGRIVFQLFSDLCPKTSKNFLCLCTGEKGTGKTTGKELCYKGSTFHRVVKNFMVQGGDFTEGNGRGGESIYGGYFEDENLLLKHDKAFLLSMANRGKDTNGSQFFITTKMAPHLDGVHVVFGLVISGFEVIKKVEGLKTDSASRPYADVRVVDCGQLFTKSANDVLEGKRKRASQCADLSQSRQGSSSGSDPHGEAGTRTRCKRRRRNASNREENTTINCDPILSDQGPVEGDLEEGGYDEDEEGWKEHVGKRSKAVVRPEEIPPVPENRFLLRRGMALQEGMPDLRTEHDESSVPCDLKPTVTKSGRKIKGRGTMRYHTPTQSKSRSASAEEPGSSETPPHWKEEMKRSQVYHPPSAERWSRGDRLNDHSSTRWGDRSDSAWSRSLDGSPGQESNRSSLHLPAKKEKKKSKRKKKSKKRRHAKKKFSKSKPPEPLTSGSERSLSSARQSQLRGPLSAPCPGRTLSSKRSSPPSSRKLRSYSRSYTSSHSRSQKGSLSYSRSRSLSRSRSRSRSLSRSRSQSYSHSRSRSRTRARSSYRSRSVSCSRRRTSSKSPRKSNDSKLRTRNLTQVQAKIPEPKVPPVAGVPTVPVPETVPVIPLSDSPPPSRWKPGQKPWKPSYVNIQEMKANPGSTPPFPSGQEPVVGMVLVQTVATPKITQGDSQSGYSPKARRPPTQRSPSGSSSGSSRGRSYSRSFSRSRSGGRSRSGSRSPHKHCSRYAVCSGSDSNHDSHKRAKDRKKSMEKEWKKYYSSLKRIKNLDKYISLSCNQSPNSGAITGGENSPNVNGASERVSSIKGEENHSEGHQVKRTNSMSNPNSRSEWDSDGDKEGQANSTGATQKPNPGASEALQRKLSVLAGWDSDSDSEHLLAKTSASEKEEGEASSESEREAGSKPGSKALPRSAKKVTHLEKRKSKKSKRKHKRKRRGETKSGSGHPKDKAKRSKRKRHKLKETFHWQPPLEFGEEDDEVENQKEKRAEKHNVSGVESTKTPDHVRNKEHNIPASGNNGSTKTPSNRREEQVHLRPRGSVHENHPKEKLLDHPSSNSIAQAQTSSADDMDICTPEHDTESIVEPVLNTTPDSTLTTIINSVSKTTQDDTLHNQVPPPAIFDISSHCAAVGTILDLKWKPLKGTTPSAVASLLAVSSKSSRPAEHLTPRPQGVKMEIKSKSRVRPGSLFDEVRKTARLNQRPRNQDSSSEEDSQAGSREESHTPRKSGSMSSHRSRSRSRSLSYSRSRSRSRRSSSSSSSRSRSRRRGGRRRSRSRSSTYRSYRSHRRTYSRSHSRSRSYTRRSRSDSDDSASSRSASRRCRRRRRSHSDRSSERRSWSSPWSSRSSSRHRTLSRGSRYS